MVPLFGDMQIAPFNYIRRSKNYDPSRWPLCSATLPSPQADLMVHLPQIREDHVKFTSELARYSNEVRLFSPFTRLSLTIFCQLSGNNHLQRNPIAWRDEGDDRVSFAWTSTAFGMDQHRHGAVLLEVATPDRPPSEQRLSCWSWRIWAGTIFSFNLLLYSIIYYVFNLWA